MDKPPFSSSPMPLVSRPFFRIATGLALAILLVSAGRAGAQPGPSVLQALEREMVNLVKRVEPSIVSVMTQRRFVSSYNGQPMAGWDSAIGSGVVIDDEGYILTTANVVEDADEIMVNFPDGQHRAGRLVGADPLSGIAVIHVDSVMAVPARLGDSDNVSAGSWAIMMGNAFGFSPSVSFGMVNGFRPEDGLLQVSAAIDPGATGGAVFSIDAKLIGLIAARLMPSAQPVSLGNGMPNARYHFIDAPSSGAAVLVIPISRVKRFAQQLIDYGEVRRSWLGVRIQSLVGTRDGMKVDFVYAGSPAEEAGLQPGDRILSVNELVVTNPITLAEYVTTIPVGSIIELHYTRQGREGVAYARLRDRPDRVERPDLAGPETTLTGTTPSDVPPVDRNTRFAGKTLGQMLMEIQMEMQRRIDALETQLRHEHEQMRRAALPSTSSP